MDYMIISPPSLYVETLSPDRMVLGSSAFEKWLGLDEVMTVDTHHPPTMMGFMPLKEEEERDESCFSQSCEEETARSQETDLHQTPDLSVLWSRLPSLQKLSHSVHSNVLQQAELVKTHTKCAKQTISLCASPISGAPFEHLRLVATTQDGTAVQQCCSNSNIARIHLGAG